MKIQVLECKQINKHVSELIQLIACHNLHHFIVVTVSKIRGRSSSYSGHLPHKKPLPLEPLKPSSTNPPPFRHSPPPTVIPSGETGNRGRGRGRSAGRVPPTRPPPPARAKSLPRGNYLSKPL